MNPALLTEIERLKRLFATIGKPFPDAPGALEDEIAQIREATGINLGSDIVDFYALLNGSQRAEIFAVFTDEAMPCEFLPTTAALQAWRGSFNDVDKYYNWINEQYEDYHQEPPRDPRIRQDVWANQRWFPFADFNGGGTRVFWDADPAPGGNIGQIIAYQHDPDAIYYVAPDFVSFLKASNDWLESNPEELLGSRAE